MIVEGYAVTYDSPTVLWEQDGIQYFEVIARGALDNADLSDVPFKYNHSDSVMIMARTRTKSLELTTDDKGLFVRAKLADTSQGRDLFKLIQLGEVDKMSFAFTVEEEKYNNETRTRTILKIKKLYDVSAVDIPAYDTTSISARNFFEVEIEKERKAMEIANLRKKLLLKTFL
jgi:HK97 family phage prohead protease